MTFFYRQMPKLVAEGHLYVAQPPLYLIQSGKKERRYVHAEDQMQAILMETGLAGASLRAAGSTDPDADITGERLKALLDLVAGIEQGLRAFGRRNRSLREFLAMAYKPGDHKPEDSSKPDPLDGLLPLYLVEHQGTEVPLYSEKERQDYIAAQHLRGEAELESESSDRAGAVPASAAPGRAADGRPVREIELHEVKVLNKHLARLRDEYGLRAEVLLPRDVTGDESPPRFLLHRDGESHPLLDLRALVPTVRKIGEKGMKITRFKGLGEMDAEQLWETTMDPARRTLLQVRLEDTAAANDLFATLMGDDVEPRREFIEKHALEVKNLDV
jgi:DNA gyrase subunit B